MNAKHLYLSIDFLSIIVPFIFSFYPKSPFYKKWKYAVPAILITSIIFIFWDVIFTKLGIWGFNPNYLTGHYFLGLPVEEILFFICIPYACLFTYDVLPSVMKTDYFDNTQTLLSYALILMLLTTGCYHLSLLYTGVTFILLALLLSFLVFRVRPRYLGQFYFSFLIILLPFLIVNGVLTGSFIEDEVVWYNNAENLNLRIGTIPVEDVFYGMMMLMMNVSIFERLQERKK